MKKRSWTKEQLQKATSQSTSIRQIIDQLGLKPAGGNYEQIVKYLNFIKLVPAI